MESTIDHDITAIARIDAVKSILEVVCRVTGLGFAAVARVTEHQWVACAVRDEISFGLQPGGELSIRTTLCDDVRDSGCIIAIDNVANDDIYRDHPTPRQYGFQSYVSAPIRMPDGRFFGTLCAIDPKPARVNSPEVLGMFTLFADLIAQHLDAQERVVASESALRTERETAQLREQFLAVVGHDLRNPLSAICGGAELLQRMPQTETAANLTKMILRGASRMVYLIDNILDFARGRLGGGFVLNRVVDANVHLALTQVVEELRTSNPTRDIRAVISLNDPIFCDVGRLSQLLSNLLANALTHGDPESPIFVRAECTGDSCEISVTNHGPVIPPHVAEHLFQPFARGKLRAREDGLGLGLYIAAEVARAHDGSLSVNSADGETRFTFRMPTSAK